MKSGSRRLLRLALATLIAARLLDGGSQKVGDKRGEIFVPFSAFSALICEGFD